MTQLHYDVLKSSRAIRLLHFLPGPEPLCQMITVEVEKAPAFLALSYTWGHKEYTREIPVDGVEVAVTANLADAIDAIYVFARTQNLMFWTDSICINQADVDERSRQVRLMNTIYRSAEFVAIWLGAFAENSDLAFDITKEWKTRFDSLRELCGGSDDAAVTQFSFDDSRAQRALEAWHKIGHRPWWTRAWIVQEGTIASPSRTIVFCSNRNIDWVSLRLALQITHRKKYYKSSGESIEFNDSMALRLDDFRKDRESGANIRLLRVLDLMRAYDCEDPRDLLYAALGMAMDINEDDIIPDYTKTCAEVYTDVVRFYVSKADSYSLDFLGHIQRPAPGSSFDYQVNCLLPSWVPDWAMRVSVRPLEKFLNCDTYGERSKAYNASGDLRGSCHINDGKLHIQGSMLDRITKVSSICEWNSAIGLDTEGSWAPSDLNESYFNGDTTVEAYNHTLVADIRSVGSAGELARGLAIDWELLAMEREQMTDAEFQKQTWLLTDVSLTTLGRRLFRTSRGLMGLGPAAAQIGDQVCVLLGGQVLYVLRGCNEGEFEFVGECYVHGMMDGLACESKYFSQKEFVLV
jgi:hypothetical protein